MMSKSGLLTKTDTLLLADVALADVPLPSLTDQAIVRLGFAEEVEANATESSSA